MFTVYLLHVFKCKAEYIIDMCFCLSVCLWPDPQCLGIGRPSMHLYVDFTVLESCRGQLVSIQMWLPKEKRAPLPSPENTGRLITRNISTGIVWCRADKVNREDTVHSVIGGTCPLHREVRCPSNWSQYHHKYMGC